MTALIQGAVVIEPPTMIEIGSVAQQAFEASDCPASPPSTKIIGICAPTKACAAASTMTFLRAGPEGVAVCAESVMFSDLSGQGPRDKH